MKYANACSGERERGQDSGPPLNSKNETDIHRTNTSAAKARSLERNAANGELSTPTIVPRERLSPYMGKVVLEGWEQNLVYGNTGKTFIGCGGGQAVCFQSRLGPQFLIPR